MAWDWEGAGTGAAGGALVGTVAMPGVGTLVGAGAGGLLGGLMGGSLSAGVDPNQFNRDQAAARKMQMQNAGALQRWAYTGEGPSNAQAILEKNRADNAARMVGMAKSMPGGDSVLANRQAAQGIAEGNAAATYQAALLRNQEQQQAMQQLQNQENQIRQTDAEIAAKKLAVEQENKKNRAGFLSGMLGMGGGAGGGLLGGLV